MGADNELTEKLRFLSGVLRAEGAINASDDVLRAAAEIDRLRGEVVNGKFLVDFAVAQQRRTPAPAMPNGVEYDRQLIAEMLDMYCAALTNGGLDGAGHYPPATIDEQAQLLRDADNHEARTVTRASDNHDAAGAAAPHWCKNCLGVAQESCPFNTTRDEPTPAAVPAGEAVACDMGPLCVGCTPRNADGSCPDATPQPAGGEAVYLVATGDACNRLPTYTRHTECPPNCDAEKLYTTPPAAPAQGGEAVAPFAWFATDDDGRYGIGADRDGAVRDLGGLPEAVSRVFPLYTAPPAAQVQGEAVAYLEIGPGGYLDLGTDRSDDSLLSMPPGKYMLGIIGHPSGDAVGAALRFLGELETVGNARAGEVARGLRKEATRPSACELGADGVGLIAAERQRQISAEGWSPEHDDEHGGGELATAAACYAAPSLCRSEDEAPTKPRMAILAHWPWALSWWKPGDRIRELVKAGALIAAEIDRLQRAALQHRGDSRGGEVGRG